MSTASAPRRREWWPAFGHHAWKIQVLAMVGLMGSLVFFHDWPLSFLTRLPLTITYAAALMAQWRHDRNLCERCMANFPLDPAAEVKRHRRALRSVHLLEVESRNLRYALMAVVIGVSIGVHYLPEPFSTVAVVVLIGVLGVGLAWAGQQHKRLQPWCPQCRHGGRGKETFNPLPVPPETHEKDPVS